MSHATQDVRSRLVTLCHFECYSKHRGMVRGLMVGLVCVLSSSVFGCHDLTQDQGRPAGTPDPTIFRTRTGVLQETNGALALFSAALGQYVIASGIFTDELTTNSTLHVGALDKRKLESDQLDATGSYTLLQSARVHADFAARSLLAYARLSDTAGATAADSAVVLAANDSATLLRGHMYGIEGYSELLLADLFCAGVPLSTIDLHDGTVDYQASASRDSLYRHAMALFGHALSLFDSMTTLSAANDPSFQTLYSVGTARALLALGKIDSAGLVAENFQDCCSSFQLAVVLGAGVRNEQSAGTSLFGLYFESDREGAVGLPYNSSRDPRTFAVAVATGNTASQQYVPAKYGTGQSSDSVAVTLASAIDIRLIQAEAALRNNDTTTWLTMLNDLRNSAPEENDSGVVIDTTLQPVFCFGAQCDTVIVSHIPAGQGGVNGLRKLRDPGSAAGRRALMFSERAEWLFLTGARQGDLRRLLRPPYNLSQLQVYPNGAYPNGDVYGTLINAPIPASERANPQFHGCLNRLP